MSTTIQIASKSGITVGSTAITSGINGRVLFQSSGVVSQDQSFYWDNTNKRLSIGQGSAPIASLDVRAAGALSTDIAFRVRNSADTDNIFEVRGNGHSIFNNQVYIGFGAGPTAFGHKLNMRLGLSTSIPFAYFDNASFNLDMDRFCNIKLGFAGIDANSTQSIALGLGTVPSSRNYQQTVAFWTAISQGTNDSGFAQSGADTAGNNSVYTNYYGKNIVLGGTTQGNGKNVFVMLNGTAPSTNIANGGQLYVEGGALKFRGSSGTISTVAPA